MKFNFYWLKRFFTIAVALIISLVVNYFFSESKEYWIPLAALLVMQTRIGNYVRHGIQIYVSLGMAVILYTLVMMAWHSSWNFMHLYYRLYDVTLGAAIGITMNLLFFPRRPDDEFRQDSIKILQASSEYLAAIFHFLFDPATRDAQEKKFKLEKTLTESTPIWVYQVGFSVALREGYRHFLVMMDRLEQVLFSLHYIVRYSFDSELIRLMEPQLVSFVAQSQKIIQNIVTILELRKLNEKVGDLSSEIIALEKIIRDYTPEELEPSPHSIYAAAWLENLKDLRWTLIRLAEALR